MWINTVSALQQVIVWGKPCWFYSWYCLWFFITINHKRLYSVAPPTGNRFVYALRALSCSITHGGGSLPTGLRMRNVADVSQEFLIIVSRRETNDHSQVCLCAARPFMFYKRIIRGSLPTGNRLLFWANPVGFIHGLFSLFHKTKTELRMSVAPLPTGQQVIIGTNPVGSIRGLFYMGLALIGGGTRWNLFETTNRRRFARTYDIWTGLIQISMHSIMRSLFSTTQPTKGPKVPPYGHNRFVYALRALSCCIIRRGLGDQRAGPQALSEASPQS